jgi:hypothetical protein
MRLGRPIIVALLCALTTAPAAGAATFKPISTNGLGLTKTGLDDAAYAQIAALEKTHPQASVGDVIASANRSVRPLGSSPALSSVRNVQGGFRWNTGDDDVSYWYPQGISGSADAIDGGVVDGHRELLVSWYSKNGKGARISFVNADKLESAKYRHVLLVDRNMKPITTHAGGIAWYGHYLYVAETHVGLRVFDMQHILKASIEGYAYALPQAGTFRTTSELTFSFVSVDRATPSLLTGEYVAGKAGGRLVQWTLGADGLLVPGGARGAWTAPVKQVQGGLLRDGKLTTSSSNGSAAGTLLTGAPNAAATSQPWSIGAEDLSFAPTSGRLYSLTEKPGQRVVFAVPAP